MFSVAGFSFYGHDKQHMGSRRKEFCLLLKIPEHSLLAQLMEMHSFCLKSQKLTVPGLVPFIAAAGYPLSVVSMPVDSWVGVG